MLMFNIYFFLSVFTSFYDTIIMNN